MERGTFPTFAQTCPQTEPTPNGLRALGTVESVISDRQNEILVLVQRHLVEEVFHSGPIWSQVVVVEQNLDPIILLWLHDHVF